MSSDGFEYIVDKVIPNDDGVTVVISGLIAKNGELTQAKCKLSINKELVITYSDNKIILKQKHEYLEVIKTENPCLLPVKSSDSVFNVIPIVEADDGFLGYYVEFKGGEIYAIHYAGKFNRETNDYVPAIILKKYTELSEEELLRLVEETPREWVNIITDPEFLKLFISKRMLIDPLFVEIADRRVLRIIETNWGEITNSVTKLAPPIVEQVLKYLSSRGVKVRLSEPKTTIDEESLIKALISLKSEEKLKELQLPPVLITRNF